MQTGHDTPSPGGRLGALFERARRGRAAGREERGEAAARRGAGDRESPPDRRDGMAAAGPARAGPGRQLSPQVLSGRLRRLEETGYVRHAEISRIPRRRSYWLLPRGRLLIEDLGALGCREDGQEAWPRAGAAPQ